MTHRTSVLTRLGIKHGQIPSKGRVYLCWWFGRVSWMVGIQVGHFRFNIHWDRFDTLEDLFDEKDRIATDRKHNALLRSITV